MSPTLTPTRADSRAQQLADSFNRQAEAHDQAATESGDPFESAAHQGAARDLRERARQALSQTEAARRAEQAQRAHEQQQSEAKQRATDAAAAYEQAAAAYITGEEDAVQTLLRAATGLTELADAVLHARTVAEQAAAAAQLPAPADLIEAHIHRLLAERRSPERAGLVNAARTSPAVLAPRLGLVVAQLADTRAARKQPS